jgi:SOS-response transcriptional repressor LexA
MSPQMKETLDYIRQKIEETGAPPTQTELAKWAGRDRKSIRQRLHALRRLGYITWEHGRFDTMRLVDRKKKKKDNARALQDGYKNL